jgi:hypothetical protein
MLYYLALAFKIWMLIDAVQRRAEYYWFFIIFLVPFGDVVYFFVVKIHDYGRVRMSLTKQFAIKTGSSVKELRYHLKETPSTANHLALATALYDRKQYREARELYEAVLSKTPKEKPALHGLGLCQAALADHQAAISTFKRVLDIDLSYLSYGSWRALATALLEAGDKEQALECLRELLQRDSRLEHKTMLAEALLATGNSKEAAELLDTAIDDYKHSPRYVQRANRPFHKKAKQLLKAAA